MTPEMDKEIRQLREMDAFRTHFLNMVAHELNTPLTPLRLQMHLLRTGLLGELEKGQLKAIEIAERNVRRISALVTEILDVARMQSGGLRFNVETFRVHEAVAESIESFEDTAKSIGVSLASDVRTDLVVKTDRARLVQILLNLLSNSLKFTPAGGRVVVSASSDGAHIIIEVTDTGAGLSEEQITKLFRPFSQLHDMMDVTAPGSGLGLYICRGLVEAMGGQIGASSPGPGQGSTFRFTLPPTTESPPMHAVPSVIIRNTPEDAARRIRELI